MRRVMHVIVAFVTLLALVLLAASVVFWVRGRWRADWVKLHVLDESSRRWTGYHLCTTREGVYVSYSPFVFEEAGAATDYAVIARGGDLRLPGAAAPVREWSHESGEPQGSGFERGPVTWARRLGFGMELETSGDRKFSYRFDRAHVPYWFLCLVFLAVATPGVVWWRRRLVRRGRSRRGECLACGYDLRATPGRCPECGRGISVAGEMALG